MFHVKHEKIKKIRRSVSHETFLGRKGGYAVHKTAILRAKSDIFEKSERIAAKGLKISAFHGTIRAVSLLILCCEQINQKGEMV